MSFWDWLRNLFRKRKPAVMPAPEVKIMANDISISWVPPTLDTANKPTTISKVTIYERVPGGAVNKVLEITDAATLAAKTVILPGYFTTSRLYEFAVTSTNSEGESAMSPFGSDSLDIPQAMGAPGVRIVPKP